MSQASKQPLSISDIISHSLKLCCCTYKKVLLLAFVVSLMALLGGLVWHIPAMSTGVAILISIISVVMFVVAVITGISAYSAMVSIVVKNLHGQLALSRNEALRASLKLFWPVLGSIVLAYLVVGVGCMVFLIPGIFFFVALFVYLPIVIIDRKGPLEGFGESVRLTWGNWWRTFWVLSFAMICYGIGYALVAVIVVGLPNLLTHFVHPLMNAYLLDIVNLIIGTVFMPWFAALALVLLNDFKVRQTG